MSDLANVDSVILSLQLPDAIDMHSLIARVEAAYGKKLQLTPVSGKGWGKTTGLWVDTVEVGFILYRTCDPVIYQQHSICHELGHILLRHTGCTVLNEKSAKNLFQSIGRKRGMASLLAPGNDRNIQEIEAETLAFKLAEKLHPPYSDSSIDEVFGL